MIVSCDSSCTRAVTIAAILFCASTLSAAEGEAEPDEDAPEEVIEEIVVYGYKSGDEIDMDARYEELFRSTAAAELDRLEVLNEEYEWRKSAAADEGSSRIKWGYESRRDRSDRKQCARNVAQSPIRRAGILHTLTARISHASVLRPR